MCRLSVIIPVYNEVESIQELFGRIIESCAPFSPFEIIAIDDGSTDGSFEAMEKEKQLYPETSIRLIRFVDNAGKSDALDAGFHAAKGDLVATIDADLQNPPEEISKLISSIGEHALSAGRRIKREDTVFKRIASRFANFIRCKLLKDNSNDTACGLKVFKREVLQELPMFKGMHRFFPALLLMKGYTVTEIVIKDDLRKYGHSKYGTFSRGVPGLFDMLAVFWMRKRKLTYKIDSDE